MNIKTQYAYGDDVCLAYQVFGNAPDDIILVPGIIHTLNSFTKFMGIVSLLRSWQNITE